jgi:hypothetical protein
MEKLRQWRLGNTKSIILRSWKDFILYACLITAVLFIEAFRLERSTSLIQPRLIIEQAKVIQVATGTALEDLKTGKVHVLPSEAADIFPVGSVWGSIHFEDEKLISRVLLTGARGSVCFKITESNSSLVFSEDRLAPLPTRHPFFPELTGLYDLNSNCDGTPP